MGSDNVADATGRRRIEVKLGKKLFRFILGLSNQASNSTKSLVAAVVNTIGRYNGVIIVLKMRKFERGVDLFSDGVSLMIFQVA
jgi:ABC-type uncharacterized transport system permease subunit